MTRRLANRESDARRRAQRVTRGLYNTARWQRIRKRQLGMHPVCKMCLDMDGKVTPATVCDHVKPHRDDVDLFWSGPFQSLCTACHSSRKQREELGFAIQTFGPDGYPIR